MKQTLVLTLIAGFLFSAPIAEAAPDISTIVSKSKSALEAGRQGTRKVVITVKNEEESTSEWTARNAHKDFEDGKGALLVVLAPENLKGIAHLVWTPEGKQSKEWVYYPQTRRVRMLTSLTAYNSVQGTDFTWSDLGISDPGGEHRFLAQEEHAGKQTYKIETIPEEKRYYSRIVSWISADNFIPIQRDYYNTDGRLWKTKTFENIVVRKNITMPLMVCMKDVIHNRSTEVHISEVCFDAPYIPREAFFPLRLPEASLSPVCAVPVPEKKQAK